MLNDADAAELATVKNDVLSPLVIGAFLSCCATGFVLVLAGHYFYRFGGAGKDKPLFRGLVGLLVVVVLGDAAAACSWAGRWTLDGMSDTEVLTRMPVELAIGCFTAGFTVAISQGFYIARIHILAGRSSHILVGVFILILVAGLGTQLAVGIFRLRHSLFTDLIKAAPILLGWCSIIVLNDLLISLTMFYHLIWQRRGLPRGNLHVSESPLSRIATLCAQTNSLATALQIVIMVLIGLYATSLQYSSVVWLEVKVYAGSLIATLNARQGTGAHFDSHSLSSSTPHGKRITVSRSFLAQQSLDVQVDRQVEIEVDSHSPDHRHSAQWSVADGESAESPYGEKDGAVELSRYG